MTPNPDPGAGIVHALTEPDATMLHEQEDADAAAQLALVERMLSRKQLRSIVMSAEHVLAFWVGAVSAGKTFASLLAFLIALLQVKRGERVIIVGRTLHTINGNIMTQLMNPTYYGPIARTIVYTPGASTAIILGRVVELIGAPTKLSVGAIQGATIKLAYVDEATLIPAEFFRMLETRLRVEGARLIATMNPASKNHYIRKEYILRAADHDLVTFYFTMRDNPSLARSYILRQIRAFAGLFFQRFILGLWTNAAGAIYDMWDEQRHVIDFDRMPPIERVLCVAIDYGASHATSAVMLGVTAEYDQNGMWRPRLVAIDEWRHKADPEAGVAQMAPSLMAKHIAQWLEANRGIGRPQFVFVDPSAAGFREELRVQRVTNWEADNDHAGIQDIASLLAQDRMLVTTRCTGILEEVTEYSWDEKKTEAGVDEPVKINDDSMDAWRYAVRSTKGVWQSWFSKAYDDMAA